MSEETLPNDLGELTEIVNWANTPNLIDLKTDLEEAVPHQQEQCIKVEAWLEKLRAKKLKKNNLNKNKSRHVPRVIRKQAEWRYPSLTEPFLNDDSIFDVQAVTHEDVKSAEQNKLLLNHQFNTQLNKIKLVDEAVRTSVEEGTVIFYVGWEYEDEVYLTEEPIVELYPNPEFATIIQEAIALKQNSPSEYEKNIKDELKVAVDKSIETGTPWEPKVVEYKEVERTRVLKNQPEIEILHYTNFFIDPTAQGDMNKASFAVRTFETNISELRKYEGERYFNLDKILLDSGETDSEEHYDSDTVTSFKFRDNPRKKIVVHEYWGLYDINSNGKLVPIVAAWVGNQIIRMEENPFPHKKLPFVLAQNLPVRKSFYGEPDGELLGDNQDIIGAVMRGIIDLLATSANAQTGTMKNMLDSTNLARYRQGLDYQFNPSMYTPEQIFHQHKFPEIPQSAPVMLELQNQEAESLTGVKAFSSGLSGDSLGQVATAVRGVLDSASRRELAILRRLAQAFVEIGKLTMANNGEFLSEYEVIRVTNEQFIPVFRDELVGQHDLKLSIASTEEDNIKAQEIAFTLQTTGNNLPVEMVQQLFAKMFRLRKMPDLAEWMENYKPEPDPLAVQAQQLEIEKLKAEVAKIKADAYNKVTGGNLNEARADNLEADTDNKSLDFIEEQEGVKHARDVEKIQAQAVGNIALERIKSQYTKKGKES